MREAPELSVVLPTGHVEQAAWVIRALTMRASEARLELIVLYENGEPPPEGAPPLARFAASRFIRTDTTRSAAAARAKGVEAAGAELVVFSEPHCFPRAGWARALLDAHAEGEWTAVGPQFECANHGAASEAILIGDYTDWIAPAERREVEHLPGHNSAYRREALLALGDELPALLEGESVLHRRLRERGARLLHEPAATVAHRNFTRPRVVWPERRAVGRAFAATRARGWGRGRRVGAAAATLALPPLLLWRRIRQARRLGKGRTMIRGMPALLTAVGAQAVGELQGYLGGLGDAPRRLAAFELSPRLDRPPIENGDRAALSMLPPMGKRPNPVRRAATRLRRRRGIHPALERQLDSPPPWMYPWDLGHGLEVPLLGEGLDEVHETRTAMLEAAVREAIASAGPECRVIDLATNEGWYAHKVLEWGAKEVIGIDIRWQNVRRAELVRDHFGVSSERMKLREADVFGLDLEELGRFDVCLCLGLIYHIENPVGLVRTCRELTKPGGLCVIETQLTRHEQHIDWYLGPVRHKSPGSYALFVEPDSATNPVASTEGIISFIPNRAAIEETGKIAGFGEVEWPEPPADGEERFVTGDRGVALLR